MLSANLVINIGNSYHFKFRVMHNPKAVIELDTGAIIMQLTIVVFTAGCSFFLIKCDGGVIAVR